MKVRTLSITVDAPRVAVYNFLADVENLPKWSFGFGERLELRHNGWWAYTTLGEMIVESETDDRTGVIDLRIGPSPDRLDVFFMRVISLSVKRTLVSFTFVQPPELVDEHYAKQYRTLLIEMQALIRRFGGGELHAPETVPEFKVLGLN